MSLSPLFSLLLILVLFVGGCALGKERPTDTDSTDLEASEEELPITETYWKLVKLNGQAVVTMQGRLGEIFMLLKEEENRLTGFVGCSTMRGFYELEEDNRLRFRQVALNDPLCLRSNFAGTLIDVLNQADTYITGGNTLTLHFGRRGPLAVFHAVSR